jgi:hypothetical protein
MRRVPLPFVLALAGGATMTFALALARASTRRDPSDMHSLVADLVTAGSQGLAILVGVLLVVGAVGLRRRDPALPVGVLLVGAALLLAAAIARPIGERLLFERLPDYHAVLEGRRWLGWLDATGAVAFAAGLVFLGEHVERVRSLAVPLFALALVAHPSLAIADYLARALGDVPGRSSVWEAAVGLGAIQLAFAAAALATLAAALRGSRVVCLA